MKHIKLFENHNIDNILDKISDKGIDSLSKNEIDYLDSTNSPNKLLRERLNNVRFIQESVMKNEGSLGMGELQAEASPVVTEESNEIHLVEMLFEETCDVVVYGGHNLETVMNEYQLTYSELSDETISEICNIIRNSYYFED